MRIIKNPNPVEEQERKCEACGCIFAYSEGDIRTYSYSNDILGPGYYGYRKRYVLCPNCGKEIVVEEKSSDGRDSMFEGAQVQIDIQKLIEDSEEKITGTELGPDIEELTMYPHLTKPEDDGEE